MSPDFYLIIKKQEGIKDKVISCIDNKDLAYRQLNFFNNIAEENNKSVIECEKCYVSNLYCNRKYLIFKYDIKEIPISDYDEVSVKYGYFNKKFRKEYIFEEGDKINL